MSDPISPGEESVGFRQSHKKGTQFIASRMLARSKIPWGSAHQRPHYLIAPMPWKEDEVPSLAGVRESWHFFILLIVFECVDVHVCAVCAQAKSYPWVTLQ